MTRLYRITLPYACFGIIVSRGRVVEAAPIARWMVGKDGPTVRRWVSAKGGTVEGPIE